MQKGTRHKIEVRHIRSEEVEYSHGRTGRDVYSDVYCTTCKEILEPESRANYTTERLAKLETNHNLDKVFELLESINRQLSFNRKLK